MKAMVFAAGLGTRLREISQTTPKCLVDVGGVTMLERVLKRLAAGGVTRAVVNVHHRREQVENFVRSRRWDLEVLLSPEETLLGTGGGLKNARTLLDATEPFFVHNADIFSELDLAALAGAHRPSDLATLAIMDRPTSRALLFDERGALVGWANGAGQTESIPGAVGTVKPRAFSGIQIVSPLIFDYLERDTGDFSIIRTYLHGARDGALVRGYSMDGVYWIDVGTPEKLTQLRARIGAANGG